MKRHSAFAVLVATTLAAAPAAAANLTIVKSTAVVADQVSTLNPKALPGSTVDYTVTITNPLANVATPVAAVVITEPIASDVQLRVDNLVGTSGGPVEFQDGALVGLLASGLTYTYTSLTSATDKLEFNDGNGWNYQPTSTGGYDANVRAIRVTLTGTHATGGTFRLRYRVQVK